MHSKRFPTRALLLGCLALALGALGCSQSPTAPIVDRGSASALTASPVGDSPNLTPVVAPTTTTVAGATSSKTINPLLGGTVSAGQFKVIIPPAALRQVATVTVCQPRLDQRQVELSINPPSANGFLLPVLLVANCSDMSPSLLKLQTIWWWNPSTMRWEAVLGVQIDLLGKTLTAPLWHFSTYKVGGKAGW